MAVQTTQVGGRQRIRLNVKTRLFGGFLIVVALTIVLVVVVYANLQTIEQASNRLLYKEVPMADHAMRLMILARNEQQLLTDLSLTGNDEVRGEIEVVRQAFAAEIAAIRPLLEGDEVALLEEVKADEETYAAVGYEMAELFMAGEREAGLTRAEVFGAAAEEFIGDLQTIGVWAAASMDEAMVAVDGAQSDAVSIAIAFGVVAVVSAVVLGLYLSVAVSRGVLKVAHAAAGIAEGDLDQKVDVNSHDELGEMAVSVRQMIAYLQEMAAAAERIANGDLTTEVTPRSEKDELGNAFHCMTANLRKVVDHIQRGASDVAAASAQLGSTTEQTAGAAQQVTQTIQQVAEGANQQAESVSSATSNVEQMAQAAEGIAKGAQEQAAAIQQASALIAEVASLVGLAERAAGAVNEAGGRAADAARQGMTSAEQMSRGMATIQMRTSEAAEKVQAMGARSAEIGRIVEMIDDIADKTDMLALNAAVEAARAGEHGRGFAVVADQVRKLAEDSKAATREIGEVIKRVQEMVKEVVVAMAGSAAEVDSGAAIAEGSKRTLEEILVAVEEVAGLTEENAAALAQVRDKNDGVVATIESVSAVVEENTASAEEMAAASGEMTEAVQGVASVSEENSAAAQEVCAATEEVTAQVEEMAATAETLSQTAADLRAIIVQFRLSANESVAEKIEVFKQAHLRWVHRLDEMLAGKATLQLGDVASHDDCILGQWIYGRGQVDFGGLPEFVALETPHVRLHQAVRSAVMAYNRGDRSTAEAGRNEAERMSHEIVAALDRLSASAGGGITASLPRPAAAGVSAPVKVRAGNGRVADPIA